MTMTTAPSRVEADDVVALRAPTLGWALRRTLLGIFILAVSVAGAACLLYASIDPEDEAQGDCSSARTCPGAPELLQACAPSAG